MQPLCKDVIAQWVSAIREFQVRHLHQPPCSTSSLLASNYIYGHFHLIPLWGVAGGISVTSCSFTCAYDTLRKCCLIQCGRTRVPRHRQQSMEKGKHPEVVDPWTAPALPVTPPGSATRHCCRMGKGMLTAVPKPTSPENHPSSPPALSNLVCLQPQQRHVAPRCCSNHQVSL